MADDVSSLLRFGVFEADLRTAELRRQGVRVRLQSQPFLVLKTLLARPGELVTREELRQAVWPEALFVDFELGLNRAMSRLRRAIGDSASNPRFVETLPQRGYRFIAPVAGQGPGDRSPSLSCYLAWSGRESILVEGPNVIGRAEDANIQIDADTVSRHQARIVVAGKSATLEDLGSKNGTFLKGRRIEDVEPLRTDVEILFGTFPVFFRLVSPNRTTRTAKRS